MIYSDQNEEKFQLFDLGGSGVQPGASYRTAMQQDHTDFASSSENPCVIETCHLLTANPSALVDVLLQLPILPVCNLVPLLLSSRKLLPVRLQ